MPLSLAQAQALIAAAHDHAVANGWKIAVAVVDEGGLLVALGRMDGAFPLSAQIAEAKAAGSSALAPRRRAGLPPAARPTRGSSTRSAASSATAHPGPGLGVDPERRERAGGGRGEWREWRRRPRLCRGRSASGLSGVTHRRLAPTSAGWGAA